MEILGEKRMLSGGREKKKSQRLQKDMKQVEHAVQGEVIKSHDRRQINRSRLI